MKTRINTITSNEFLENFKDNLIRDFDFAVQKYFSETLKLSIVDNGIKKKVPVQMGTYERWYQNKVENNKEQINRQTDYPRMFIKQNDIEDIDDRYIPKQVHTDKIVRTKYIGRNVQGKPIWEIANIKIPTYIEISYDVSFYCWKTNQVNEIVQQILSKDKRVGIKTDNGFYIRLIRSGFSDNSNIDDFSDEQRLMGKTFTIAAGGNFFIGKDLNEANISKHYTSPKISYTERIIRGDITDIIKTHEIETY